MSNQKQAETNTAADAVKMVELMERLRQVVGEMNTLYSNNENLNIVQPDMSDCFKYSLDEWEPYLVEGVKGWKQIASELQNWNDLKIGQKTS